MFECAVEKCGSNNKTYLAELLITFFKIIAPCSFPFGSIECSVIETSKLLSLNIFSDVSPFIN